MIVDKEECCATCAYRYDLEKMDYFHGGCEHSMIKGYVCMLFENARLAVWMCGCDENEAHCECWQKKEVKE